VVLIFGVIFVELMMCFAFGLPDSLDHYAKEAPDMMFAEYQYVLMGSRDSDNNLIETSEQSAERFGTTNLMYQKNVTTIREGMGSGKDESVTIYGISEDSKYITLNKETDEDSLFVSSAFSKKFGIKEGDVISLHEEYENKSYDFRVLGVVDYEGGIAAFLDIDSFNSAFEKDADDFSGYFSRNEITDIDEQYIATVITSKDILKVTNQLTHSMGGFMEVFKIALIIMSAALIYLLAKIIIERNEHSISMVKILGFKNGEIGSLYIIPTAIVVALFAVVAFVVGYFLMTGIFHIFMLQMNGYFAFYMEPSSMVLAVVYLLIGYAFVSLVDFVRIKKIPLDVALKNVE
jgi:putative ABC transport system permease protein